MSMIKRGRVREAMQEVLDRDTIIRERDITTPPSEDPPKKMTTQEHLDEARRRLKAARANVKGI